MDGALPSGRRENRANAVTTRVPVADGAIFDRTAVVRTVWIVAALALGALSIPSARAACVAAAGAPTCDAPADPGSASVGDALGRHVGNPIDVVSGNKYQSEVDYRAVDSPLAFVRHYNSSLVDHDIGLGRGWRHGYAARLVRDRSGIHRIYQGDGRIVSFQAVGAPDERTGASRYSAVDPGDGVLEADGHHVWHLADGRTMTFVGSFLVVIGYPDGQRLRLRYERRRLASIADDHGRQLRLVYAAGAIGLGHYDERATPAGHVERLVLPDGSSVRYEHDARLNLVAAIDAAGAGTRHAYTDPDWPNHLTASDRADGRPLGRWAYDGLGRAVRWRAGEGPAAVRLDYLDDARLVAAGRTLVERHGPEAGSEMFDWTTSEDGTAQRVVARSPRPKRRLREPGWPGMVPLGPAIRGDIATSSVEERLEALIVDRVELDVPLDGGDARRVALHVDRLGTTVDVEVDGRRMSKLLVALKVSLETEGGDRRTRARSGGRDRRSPANGSARASSLAERVTRLSEPVPKGARAVDALRARVRTFVELQSIAESSVAPAGRGGLTLRGKQLGNGNACPLPKYIDCDDLRESRAMAELSACAYPGASCRNSLREVSPASIGLDPTWFVFGGVKATLYHDSSTNRYTLAFRGTEHARDWYENARNGVGMSSDQYSRAGRLGKAVNDNLRTSDPDAELTFTGHSLGGGLATLAALRTERKAVVFNSAGLHERTAQWNSTPLDDAGFLVRNYRVVGDPVSSIQRVGGVVNSVLDALWPGEQTDLFAGQAPGEHIELPKPSQTWIDARVAASPDGDASESFILHSIDSVRESIDGLLDLHCRKQTP